MSREIYDGIDINDFKEGSMTFSTVEFIECFKDTINFMLRKWKQQQNIKADKDRPEAEAEAEVE